MVGVRPYSLREKGKYTSDSVLGLATTYFRQPKMHPRRLPAIPMSSKKSSCSTTEYAVQKEAIDVTQVRRLLRLTLLAPAVVANLLANPDVAVNLESVLRRVMPLDWQEQGAVFAGA